MEIFVVEYRKVSAYAEGGMGMYCLRCGKETADNKVFCKSCLDTMEEYPVKPGQPIVLPSRPAPVPAKKGRKSKPLSNDELLDSLRHQLKVTGRLWLITAGLFLLAVLFLILQWKYGFFMPI
jgi:hypothetical protein